MNGLDLEGASFDGANLTNAKMKKIKGAEASFEGANLTGADFDEADLAEASFKGAIAVNTFFTDADLEVADFTGADITGANFFRAFCYFTRNTTGSFFTGDCPDGS
jgi:uncharacterized protein YjbI with pentapeptide repeats